MTHDPDPAHSSDPGREPGPAEPGAAEPELADRLSGGRPVPAPEFRGELRRRLVALDPGYGPRPEQLWSRVTVWLLAGALLLLLGYLQAMGAL